VVDEHSHLEEQLAKDYELKKQLEDCLRFEDDPKRQGKYKKDLKELEEQIQERKVALQVLDSREGDNSSYPLSELSTKNRSGINPFTYGPPVPPEQFYGRQQNIRDVKNRIGAIIPQCINIVGFRRSGKTSLLQYIESRHQEFCQPEQKALIVLLDLQNAQFHLPSGILEGLRRSIERKTSAAPWAQEDNEDLYAVEDGLTALKEKGQRLIVMLDEFERIGARLEQFQDWGEDWRSKSCAGLLTLVISSKRPLNELYKILHLTSPFDNIFSQTVLGSLESEACFKLLQDGFGSENISSGININVVQDLIAEWAGTLPFYFQMAASLYWQYEEQEAVQKEFSMQAMKWFQELWDDLNDLEHHALRYAAGLQTLSRPQSAICDSLQRHGLLRSDGKPCSCTFSEFARGLK
jgi:hypothetical protein